MKLGRICIATTVLCLGPLSRAEDIKFEGYKGPSAISLVATVKTVSYRRDPQGEISTAIVTFKSDGFRFFYSERSLDKPKDVFSPMPSSFQLVFDGTLTAFTVDGRTASVDEGMNVRSIRYLPFPGVSLPSTPIVRSKTTKTRESALRNMPKGFQVCLVPIPNGGKGARYSFLNGIVKAEVDQGALKVFEMMSGMPGSSLDDWKFDNHRLYEGHWVADKVRWEHHMSSPKNGLETGTDETRDYTFSSIDFGSVPASAFDISKSVKDGALVGYRNAKGEVGRFAYKPGQTWADMARTGGNKNLVLISGAQNSGNGRLALGLITFACGVIVVYQFGVVNMRRTKR